MRVIAIGTLRQFWELPSHHDAEQPLKPWFDEVKNAKWKALLTLGRSIAMLVLLPTIAWCLISLEINTA